MFTLNRIWYDKHQIDINSSVSGMPGAGE